MHGKPCNKGFNSESILYKLILTYIFVAFSLVVFSQETKKSVRAIDQQPDSLAYYEIVPSVDTMVTDSLAVIDSMAVDSVKPPVIEAPIDYNAEDSIIVSFDGQKVYLYNNAKVTYQQIELTAYFIELDLETKEVYAEGILDSTETLIQKPVFKDGTDEFESKTLRYNFETEKGIITDVVTQQGEGYIHSSRTKKITKDAFLMVDGKYTTCDAEHPHFYLHLSKAKVISNKKIITGPAYMVLEDFPIYFPFLPFGFFPNSPTYSSGILIPVYGEEQNRGFFLRDGGYYWAAGEYFDLAVRGDIYSKGSWASKIHTNYKKRYKFSGSFDFKYNLNKYGEKGLDTYYTSKQFAVTWSHSQDSKANPNQTFSASVNFSTSGYDKQNSTTASDYLSTTKSSSISFTKNFENTPFNMSVNLRHSQNSTDSTITLSMPEMTFSMSKVYPFRRKNRSGPLKWYENYGINYTANMKNSITAQESEILNKSLAEDWNNGIKHSIPITFPSFNLFKYVNVSPSISYNEKWYFKKYDYYYDPEEYYVDEDGDSSFVHVTTIKGLNRVYDYSYSLSTSTNIYGMFVPLNPNSRIKGIRHKMTPSISFSYKPDFGAARFGYWKAVQVDSTGEIDYFDVNEDGIYGGSPSRGETGAISFSLSNNLEMKVLNTKKRNQAGGGGMEGSGQTGSRNDDNEGGDDQEEDEKYKKVKLIDNLGFSGSYNLIADSLNLSTISMQARTTVSGVSVNMSGTLDPYMVNDDYERINKFVWNEKHGLSKLGRLTRASLSFGMNFKSKDSKQEGGGAQQGQGQGQEQGEMGAVQDKPEEESILPDYYPNYADFSIPWDFSFDYSFNYSTSSSYPKGKFTQTLGFRGNLSLTPKWKISMNTNFDIMAQEFSYTTFSVTRDLHCWQMAFSFVPFGYMKSYSFTINAKSTLLKDLKLSKRQSHYDNL